MTAALSTALLSACSDEVMTSQEQRGDEISFRASTENLTRTVDSYCNNNLPGQFNIYARTSKEKKAFFSNEVAIRENGKSSYNLSGGVRYWPNNEGLDFLAFHNDNGTFNEDFENPQFVNYTINDNVEEQLDLIYAKEYGKTRPAEGGNVNLNFRHALSQVVFRAKVTNPNISVAVKAVTIGNLKNKGTFTYPSGSSTSGNFTDHETNGVNDFEENTVGSWSDLSNTTSGELNYYTISLKENLSISSSGTDISKAPNHPSSSSEGWSNVMTLLPQQNEAWDPKKSGDTGTYLGLYCTIINSASNANDASTIHRGYIYVPLAIDWKPGVRYVYTVNFGYGQAGYYDPQATPPGDEDPDPKIPDNPDPTLERVTVTCTTDDFQSADYDNVEESISANGVIRLHYNYGNDSEDNFNSVYFSTSLPDFKYYFVFDEKYDLKRTNYKFRGWAKNKFANYEGVDFPSGSYTWLNLTKDANNVFDYYAIWGEYGYTVTYTDGVKGETVFEDQGQEGLYEGDLTPEFTKDLTREGYEFMGWAPAIKSTVDSSMATNKVITYTATWKKITPKTEEEPESGDEQ